MTDISAAFGVKSYETLTGFKFIGEVMTARERTESYLVGGEESYGFLVGDLVRDKDAVNACAFMAEMTAFYCAQGKSLFEVLQDIYVEHGFYQEKLISLTKKRKSWCRRDSTDDANITRKPTKAVRRNCGQRNP